VYQAGTLSGNPLAVAAGLATLALLNDAAYDQLARTTAELAAGLAGAAADAGVAVQVPHVTGLLTVFFADRPVDDYSDAQRCDMDAYAAFCRALLELGVYPPASQYEAWFPSLAHTPEHVERTVTAAREAFGRLA
jgi:glutamate-1-semialdehyde 2,1-aminomutase